MHDHRTVTALELHRLGHITTKQLVDFVIMDPQSEPVAPKPPSRYWIIEDPRGEDLPLGSSIGIGTRWNVIQEVKAITRRDLLDYSLSHNIWGSAELERTLTYFGVKVIE